MVNPRKRWLSLFFSLVVVFATAVSCTTSESDSADGLEEELNEEMEDLQGAEDVAVAEEAEAEETEASESSEVSASEDADTEDLDSEDEEFFAEDSQSPASPQKENLEEKDLQNELEKEQVAVNENPQAPEAQAAAEPPAAAPVPPADMEDPMTEGELVPTTAAVSPAASTARSETTSADGFEVINPPVPQEDLGVSDPLVAEVDPPLPSLKAAQEVVPLAKINKDPFFRNERLMNTVYIVRPNEDLAIISQKIFNEDKTSLLFADNPHLSKGLETGDKVYYNSPHRPDDKKSILTFYEDNKMTPQYYVTRKGDDIKKIGREVLGHEEGWKEIWSTNESLQTQALLPAGLKVRYWSGSEPKAYEPQTVAQTEITSSASLSDTPPPPEPLTEIPPSPEPAALPTEDPGMSAQSLPAESLSAVPSAAELPAVKAPEEGSDLMTVAAIALIAMAGLGIVAIQIKNRKRDDGSLPPSLEFTKV